MRLARALKTACTATLCVLCACSGDSPRVADVTESAVLQIQGHAPVTWERAVASGAYLVEARETDVDVALIVDAAGRRVELNEKILRQGTKALVVTLAEAGKIAVHLRNVDHPTMKGAVALRIVRLRDADATPTERERGFEEFGAAGALLALETPEAREKSRENLLAAIRHFSAANDIAARADARYALANVEYFVRTDYPAGVAAAESARIDYEAVGDAVGAHHAIAMRAKIEIEIAWMMNAAARRAEQLAMFRALDERLRVAENFYAAHEMRVPRAAITNLRGIALLNSGMEEAASELFEVAIGLARANDDVLETARYLGNVAAARHRMGFLEDSARKYEELLNLADWSSRPSDYAAWLSNYGMAVSFLGDFDRALTAQTEALEIFDAQAMIHERANALLAIGNLYFRIGDLDRAQETLKAACLEHEKIGEYATLPSCLRISGNVASALGRHREALGFLRRAAEFEVNAANIGRTHILTASALRELGDLRGAERSLIRAMAADNALVRAAALEERGRLWLARGDAGRAIRDLRAADAAYVTLGVAFSRIDTNASLSRALLANGDVAGAAQVADVAIGLESGIRVKSANPEWRASFLSSRYAPYEARIAAELAGNARDPERIWRAFQIAEHVRARALTGPMTSSTGIASGPSADIEALRATLSSQLNRLESRLQRAGPDDGISIRLRRAAEITRAKLLALSASNAASSAAPVLPQTLTSLKASLPADLAVLAFFTGDVESDVWLLTRKELRHARTTGANALATHVRGFVDELRTGEAGGLGGKLSRELLGDLLDGISATRLLILPDGPLNGLPFAALPLPGQANDSLIDRFTLAASPSLALALRGERPIATPPARVAVISDPVYSLVDRRLAADSNDAVSSNRDAHSLARLPYSAVEARAVVNAFAAGDAVTLAGFDATASRVLALGAQELRVLHFATHARGARSPERSVLFLSRFGADGRPIPENVLTASDISRSRLHAELVVLSGCGTGEGRELRGGGVLGLTHGFLANGSRSVIASLWPIEDAPTARFMEEFYAAYRVSGRPAEALRIAQLRTRNGPAKAVWSSFVVRANEFP